MVKKEKMLKSEPTIIDAPLKKSINLKMEEASSKVNPATVRWTGIKQTILVTLLKTNAISPASSLTQEEISKAANLDLTQVRHQLNQKFYLFTTGVVKLARMESTNGRWKNGYYLTKTGVNQANSFE